jgi:hypothetical protein
VDKNDEADLFRRLYEWKLSENFDWRKRDARGQQIMADLQARLRSSTPPNDRPSCASLTSGFNSMKKRLVLRA